MKKNDEIFLYDIIKNIKISKNPNDENSTHYIYDGKIIFEYFEETNELIISNERIWEHFGLKENLKKFKEIDIFLTKTFEDFLKKDGLRCYCCNDDYWYK